MTKCEWHLCGKPLVGKQERFCSPECKNKFYVSQRRKELNVFSFALIATQKFMLVCTMLQHYSATNSEKSGEFRETVGALHRQP